MKIILSMTLLLAACGDTGCEVKEYRITEQGQSQRCVEHACPGLPTERRCF